MNPVRLIRRRVMTQRPQTINVYETSASTGLPSSTGNSGNGTPRMTDHSFTLLVLMISIQMNGIQRAGVTLGCAPKSLRKR